MQPTSVLCKFFRRPPRGLAVGCLAATLAVLSVSPSVADAKRLGGGSSLGRQSSNAMPRAASPATPSSATTPHSAAPATSPTPSASAPSAAAPSTSAPSAVSPTKPATASAAPSSAPPATAPARSGASRWLGPIAGIAAGLGLGALLSHLGLSGAFAETLASVLLIAVVVFAVLFVLRRLFGGAPRTAMQGAGGPIGGGSDNRFLREAGMPAAAPAPTSRAAASATYVTPTESGNDPARDGFDTTRFLQQAKTQFVNLQAVWDTGDTERLREFLTDDFIAELKPQIEASTHSTDKTEVVLLNAEMLGIETVSDGCLASVRFSGMLRESRGAEAIRFEEVWRFLKPEQSGWLLAGIQQVPAAGAN